MTWKKLSRAAAGCLLVGGTLCNANAWQAGGFVACDANTNGIIDGTDIGLSGVLVVVTNTSGTFSNANWSSIANGGYAVQLPPVADSYIAYLHPLTLYADATILFPTSSYYSFTLDGVIQSNFLGSFLVSSTNCVQAPPPPDETNTCCLAGAAKIGSHKKKPLYLLGGELGAGIEEDNWQVFALAARLRFQAKVVEVLNCGVEGTNGGEYRFIEFHGIGKLKGNAGCKADYGLVHFLARVEDQEGENGDGDRVYFRAYAEDGTTLLLISDNPENPLEIAPLAISYGGFAIWPDCRDDDDNGQDCDRDEDHNGYNKDKNRDRDKSKDDCPQAGKDKAKGKNNKHDQAKNKNKRGRG